MLDENNSIKAQGTRYKVQARHKVQGSNTFVTCTSYLVPCAFSLTYICAMKILMVCLGNICRSPLAEGILQDKAFKAGLKWSVESAGTNSYHIGEAPHPLSQKAAKLNGIDIC